MKQTIYIPTKVEDETSKEGITVAVLSNDEFGELSAAYYVMSSTYKYLRNNPDFDDAVEMEIQPTHWLKPTEGLFFTPEEYNKHIEEVIKDVLDTAAKSSKILPLEYSSGSFTLKTTKLGVDKESITNTLEQSYNKWKI